MRVCGVRYNDRVSTLRDFSMPMPRSGGLLLLVHLLVALPTARSIACPAPLTSRLLRVPSRVQPVLSSHTGKSVAGKAEEPGLRALDGEFIKIAAPAFVQFAADPIARLIDTVYLGRLGTNALGGASAAIAAQYSVAKLYNDPVLRTTISLVAAQEGRAPEARTNAVCTALLLALVVGVVQGTVFFVLSGPILSACCVGPASPMRSAAMGYLRVCSLGAPTTTLWLATNGIFRGLGDTATPLVWALAFSAMNALLDPIFIFRFGMGAAGAAAGTALSQTIALLPLLLALQRKLRAAEERAADIDGADFAADNGTRTPTTPSLRRRPIVGLFVPSGGLPALLESLRTFVQAGSYVLLRSIARISTYTVCSREAARLGAVASSAHNLCFQLGVATTQLCESIGLATQTLLARELSQASGTTSEGGDAPCETDGTAPSARTVARARHVLSRGLALGMAVASALSMVTFANRRGVVAGLTTIPEVRAAACAVMPLVLLCQVLKGLAYPVNGALMGALDWRASAGAMVAAQVTSVALVAWWSRLGKVALTLNRLWGALAALFAVQIGVSLVRIASKTGPWKAFAEQRDARGPEL